LNHASLNIIADANIPRVAEMFSCFGKVTLMDGRNIHQTDLKSADVLLTRSVTQVNAQLLKGTAVKFVGSATIGIDHIDTDYLQKTDIGFANAPGCNAKSVVEYVFTTLAFTHQLTSLLKGEQVLGIIGLGNVGSLLNHYCAQLGIKTRCCDPFVQQTEENCRQKLLVKKDRIQWGTLNQVLSSEVITLHVPMTVEGQYPTFHLINAKNQHLWGKAALLINASRGAVVDNQIILNHLQASNTQVALDVWEHEPNICIALRDHCSIATPHIAGYSQNGKLQGTEMILAAFCQYFNVTQPHLQQHNGQFEGPITWNDKLPLWEALSALLLDAYPIDRDSVKLKAVEASAMAVEFDQLRKNYPIRREFHHWKVIGNVPELGKQALRVLGFNLKVDEDLD